MKFIVIFIVISIVVGIIYSSKRRVKIILSQEQARAVAYKAIGGFDQYDKTSLPAVELNNQEYYVTFAFPPGGLLASRASDYAIRVVIDAWSGKVIKILTSQ